MTVFLMVSEADKKQSNSLQDILQFNDKYRPRSKADEEKKRSAYESVNTLYEAQE